MVNPETYEKAVDALFILNTAIKNLRLYPPSSAMIINTIDKLHETFQAILMGESVLVFAESERHLLICGEAVSQKDYEKPQIAAFLELLLQLNIKSLSFEQGMGRDDLAAFLALLGMKPEKVIDAGGLPALIKEKKITHILLNEKIYIEIDKDHQAAARIDVSDDQIIQYLTSGAQESDITIDQVRDMMKDPQWIDQIFRSGITQIMQQSGALTDTRLSEELAQMLHLLDKVTDKVDQDRLARLIGKSIAEMDPEMISHTLAQGIDERFGGKLFQHVVGQIDAGKLALVIGALKRSGKNASLEKAIAETAAAARADGIHDPMMDAEKERWLQDTRDSERTFKNRRIEEHKSWIQNQAQQILNGDEAAFQDTSLMASVPSVVCELADSGEQETVQSLIDGIVVGLFSTNPDVRSQAATTLLEVLGCYPDALRQDLIERLAERLLDWIRLETVASRSYEAICRQLQLLARHYILQRRFSDTLPILNVFNEIQAGILEKNDRAEDIAAGIMDELASEELLDILFGDFQADKQEKQAGAGKVLVRLGHIPINRLLDMLREHDDSNERVRILQLIGDSGSMSVPLIRARIRETEPWYYLRNLAYLLGRIGSESTVDALEPLLLNKNNKVRQEALKSLHRTGGNGRGPVLLSLLPAVDDPFKINIVEMLGTLKYVGAANPLLNMLKDRPRIVPPGRVNLEEKICTALGNIGAPEAVPELEEISRARGFFSTRTYAEKVRNAAEKAVAMIRRKQAEAKKSMR